MKSFGSNLHLKMRADGRLVPMTSSDRVRAAARSLWRWLSRAPRMVVVAVDAERGVITYDTEHWSWLRWRWQREGRRPQWRW